MNLTDAGNAQPRDRQHLDQAGGDLLAQLLEEARTAGGCELGDDLQGSRADPLRSGE
jgi:hypothetical protein